MKKGDSTIGCTRTPSIKRVTQCNSGKKKGGGKVMVTPEKIQVGATKKNFKYHHQEQNQLKQILNIKERKEIEAVRKTAT